MSPQIPTIRPAGPSLTLENADELKESLAGLLRGGSQCLVVDLTDVTFLDSTILGVLVAAQKRASAGGGTISLAVLSPNIQQTCAAVRLETIIPIFATLADAHAALPSMIKANP
jgi:anti-sigma B factor antagonist